MTTKTAPVISAHTYDGRPIASLRILTVEAVRAFGRIITEYARSHMIPVEVDLAIPTETALGHYSYVAGVLVDEIKLHSTPTMRRKIQITAGPECVKVSLD